MADDTSFTELYELAKAAYKDLISGKIQSYSIGGRTFTYMDADKLWQQVQNLKSAAAEESGYGRTTHADFRRGSNQGTYPNAF
jgi:hypothetical protein